MSGKEAKQNAERFLKEQAEIMRKYGDAPKLRGAEYKSALEQTAKTFQALSETRTGKAR